MSALRTLLAGAIDYAGLFPPASLDMARAVRNYAEYKRGDWAWALGRFLLPAARIEEFEADSRGSAHQWRLSSIGMPPQFHAGDSKIDTVELKITGPRQVREAMRGLPDVTAYFEIPIENDPAPFLEAIAECGARAKVRTGGITSDAFPSAKNLAGFLQQCARMGVPFKATAGLHHPLRGEYKLTYEPDSPSATMHGFVNLLLAASLLHGGGTREDAIRTLEEEAAVAFQFDADSARWHEHALTVDQQRAARETFVISFGSCSFEEPVAELRSLGWL
jgi:hypothetical protein